VSKTGLDRINSPLLCCPPNNRRELNMSIQPPTREVALFYGPQLLGCVFGIALSVIVHLQTLLYFQRYPSDQRNIKLLVIAVWCVDTFHTISLFHILWRLFILDYGDFPAIDIVKWSYSTIIMTTATTTIMVHGFYVLRLFKLSHRNWYLTTLILVINTARFTAAMGTGTEMFIQKRISVFIVHVDWLVTVGLTLSSTTDIIVTASLWYFLSASKAKSITLNHAIDALRIYALETGGLTCFATVTTLICSVTMKHNMIFMGVYWPVEKLFAISLLVTLNAREHIRSTVGGTHGSSVLPIASVEIKGGGKLMVNQTIDQQVYRDAVPSPITKKAMASELSTPRAYNFTTGEEIELAHSPTLPTMP
jgi:hypothetical protein